MLDILLQPHIILGLIIGVIWGLYEIKNDNPNSLFKQIDKAIMTGIFVELFKKRK